MQACLNRPGVAHHDLLGSNGCVILLPDMDLWSGLVQKCFARLLSSTKVGFLAGLISFLLDASTRISKSDTQPPQAVLAGYCRCLGPRAKFHAWSGSSGRLISFQFQAVCQDCRLVICWVWWLYRLLTLCLQYIAIYMCPLPFNFAEVEESAS